MVKYFKVTGKLCVAVFLCFIPHCWSRSSTVYKYLTPEDRSRLIEVEFAQNGNYTDCAVFADRVVIQDILKDVPSKHIVEMSKENVNLSTRTCHNLHLTLLDSPLRKKRALAAIYPGTKWCGRNNIADHFDDLGKHSYTDACCREHDKCPDYVMAFETKYGLYNWRPYTVCDCGCDEKFYKCLKTARSRDSAAVNIGKLFFNILRTICMKDVHPQKCVKYWWFFCIKHDEDKTKLEKQFVNSPYF